MYSYEHLSFNVHLLLLLPSYVRYWGAIWAHSTFPFEHCNGILQKFFNGTLSFIDQIYQSYYHTELLNTNGSTIFTDRTCEDVSTSFYNLIEKRRKVKNYVQINSLTLIGTAMQYNVNYKYTSRNAVSNCVPDIEIDFEKNVFTFT